MASHLNALKKAIQDKDAKTAFESLVLAWKDCRAAELFEVTQRLELAFPQTPFEGNHKAWIKAANGADAVDRGGLLAGLAFNKSANIEEAFDAISAWPADPRTSRKIESLLVNVPLTSSSSQKAWRVVMQWVSTSEEPRFVALAQRLAHEWTVRPLMKEWLVKALSKAVAPLQHLPVPTLTPADQALAAEILNLLPQTSQIDSTRIAALTSKIYANPSDDALRAELAAVLTQASDPRGEFITLQLKQDPSSADKRRIRQLSKLYSRKWVVPLSGALFSGDAEFSRGFPVSGVVKFPVQASWNEFGSREEWRTYEVLYFIDGHGSVCQMSPAMQNVKSAYYVTSDCVAGLCDANHDWALTYLFARSSLSLDVLQRLATTKRIPGLKTLRLELPQGLTGAIPLHPGLECLEVGDRFGPQSFAIPRQYDASALKQLTITDYTFARGPTGKLTHVTVRGGDFMLAHELTQLSTFPKDAITGIRLELRTSGPVDTKPLEDWAKARGITDVVVVRV